MTQVAHSEKWIDVADSIRQGLQIASEEECEHKRQVRANCAKFVGLTLVAGFVGLLAVNAMHNIVSHARAHKDWDRVDKKLDEALEQTFDASDSTAQY